MKKLLFKKILSVLDAIELHGISLQVTPKRIYKELCNDNFNCSIVEITELVSLLATLGAIKETDNGIDLYPAPTIYSKSNQNSEVEALSIFETFIRDPRTSIFYTQQIKDNNFINKTALGEKIDKRILQVLCQTALFDSEKDSIRFQPKLRKLLLSILEEYSEKELPLISTTLTALFTSSIVAHENLSVDYKNTLLPMNEYTYKHIILSIIPRRGIPHDRDETKALQAFYKDTLFHEFDHCCPLCKINIPHMLIASHIKPFRDCAHIYEAIDHNNGLLLCRNHDFLFDQGYISFDDEGYILISRELIFHKNLEKTFSLNKEYYLPSTFLSRERKQFLEYHRNNIFIK